MNGTGASDGLSNSGEMSSQLCGLLDQFKLGDEAHFWGNGLGQRATGHASKESQVEEVFTP
jgi:hypothetical protein